MNSDNAVVFADSGKEPDQRIEAEAHGGAGDNKRGVEQGRERVDPGNAGATGAGARKVEVEAISGGHRVRPPRPQMGMRGGGARHLSAGCRVGMGSSRIKRCRDQNQRRSGGEPRTS
jgi:hypothetical protein